MNEKNKYYKSIRSNKMPQKKIIIIYKYKFLQREKHIKHLTFKIIIKKNVFNQNSTFFSSALIREKDTQKHT